jgi:hypothetical protein
MIDTVAVIFHAGHSGELDVVQAERAITEREPIFRPSIVSLYIQRRFIPTI